VLEHIRDTRKDADERKAAGQTFDQLKGWLPPCSRDASAYSPHKGVEVHRDPLDFRALPSVSEEIPPYSCCPSPYRWMREENFQTVCEAENLTIRGPDNSREAGWVMEPDRQRELLKHFWGKVEPEKSLIFYYCNQGNPLDENTSRIVVGVGRIAKIAPQLYFGTKPRFEDQYPIWARCVTQDYPDQGVRIPYQEYLRGKHDPEKIICRVPSNALMSFSFVGEHVSDGVAISIIERVIQSIEQVATDQIVAGDWGTRLAWLNDVLAELWTQRGPFPGLGSVLQYLGFARGTAYHRLVLSPMVKKGVNPWEHVRAILEGRTEPAKDLYEKGLLTARQKWNERKSRQELLTKLMLFELTVDQVERIANPDLRAKSGIEATEAELVANPYLIGESDWGSSTSDPIALEAIDQGILPEGDAALFRTEDKPAKDDSRRVRAIAVAVLKEAQNEGDTLLPLGDLLERVEKYFPDKRACRLDREVFSAQRDHFTQRLWTALDGDVPLVALKDLRKFEEQLASVVKRRAQKTNAAPSTPLDWKQALQKVFGKAGTQREKAALASRTDPRDFRLPDFTVGFEGDIFYWEHLGMLTVPSYREAWERKKKWYEAQGYAGQLITSEDGPDGSIDAAQIEAIARKRILQE
jgi:hypothetical protein